MPTHVVTASCIVNGHRIRTGRLRTVIVRRVGRCQPIAFARRRMRSSYRRRERSGGTGGRETALDLVLARETRAGIGGAGKQGSCEDQGAEAAHVGVRPLRGM